MSRISLQQKKRTRVTEADAQAIWTAGRQPGTRFVPVKTMEQQSVLALHAVREHRRRVRTASMNQLCGLLSEFGVVRSYSLVVP